jgi:hypothetical protein
MRHNWAKNPRRTHHNAVKQNRKTSKILSTEQSWLNLAQITRHELPLGAHQKSKISQKSIEIRVCEEGILKKLDGQYR